MATSTVTLTALKTGETGGVNEGGTQTFTNASAPDGRTVQTFSASTFAAVSVSSGATGVYIIPPSTNAGTITLKGVTGDTGLALHPTQPSFISLATTASFGLLCSASTVVEFLWT
jgi:hypothetical protein